MSYVNSVKSIWERADNSYIRAAKPAGRTPVSRRLFPQDISEGNRRDEDNASECSSNQDLLGDFDAIPEEFRPNRRGKDLMKVRSSPKKEDPKTSAEEPTRNGSHPNEPKGGKIPSHSNSSTEARNDQKELWEIDEPKQSQGDTYMSSDDSGKQKKASEMFFFSSSSRKESTSKATNGCQLGESERENSRGSVENSKSKNAQDEKGFTRFYDSGSRQTKATNGFDVHSSFEKNKMETNVNNFYKNVPPKFQERNGSNQNRDENGTNFPKNNRSMPPKFQDKNASNQNKASLEGKNAQKFTREVTVEKRIKWNSDLCEIKKPENKPNYLYEYRKTTKESVSYVPSHDDDDDEIMKKPYQDFKKGRDFCNNFRRKDFERNNQRPVYQRSKGFNSTCKAQINETKDFPKDRPQKPGNKREEKHTCFGCGDGKDEIIVRHEIKVIHVNQRGRHNPHRMLQKSSQPFRPAKFQNGKTDQNHTKERNGGINNTDSKEKNEKVTNTTTRERSGNMTETATREYCGVQIEENTMMKTAEGFEKTRKRYVRIPMKLPNPLSKAENTHNNVPRVINSENSAALIKYGRDISDMIAGSYLAITTFLDNYGQWRDYRRVTMLLFEEVERNLSQSCHRHKRIIEVAELVGTGCKMVQYVPHVGVSVAARVIAFLSDVVARIFSASNSSKSIGMDDFQLKLSLQRDMEATTDIYMYGVQCDFNFQETCQMIQEFHRKIQDGSFKEFEESFEAGFLKEVSLLNPGHPAVFYKKLGRFYALLNERQQSEEGKAFCTAFEDWPEALTTVSRLHRRFRTDGWDSSSVMRAWEEVYDLLQNQQSKVEDVLKKIQDCICVLIREQSVMERYVMDLRRQC